MIHLAQEHLEDILIFCNFKVLEKTRKFQTKFLKNKTKYNEIYTYTCDNISYFNLKWMVESKHYDFEGFISVYETYKDGIFSFDYENLGRLCANGVSILFINFIFEYCNKNNLYYTRNININYTHNDFSNAMRKCCIHGNIEVLKYLYSITNKFPENLIEYSSEAGHIEIIKYLYSLGETFTIDAIEIASNNHHIVDFLKLQLLE